MNKVEVLKEAAQEILNGKMENAKELMQAEYPFKKLINTGRNYTDKQKMEQFKRDGFIDRYSGQKLLNPGLLKVLSYYMPDVFPYHAHWKMEECHNAYWEFVPTVDHIYPVALGGADSEENRVTTSMLHNSIKSNWTLEQLRWELKEAGNYEEWDGLTTLFVELVEADSSLLEDAYIKKWYHLSKM
ncbi:MAG: HNH endonuclease [Lachnospiraceae bacterium]|nr:HNH endonuclease [Lachnospiraceae bacterium]